jgi:hypothetical protein
MTCQQAFRLIVMATAAVSIGGAWALVPAQTGTNTPRNTAPIVAPPAAVVRVPNTTTGGFFTSTVPGRGDGIVNWQYAVPVESDPETGKLAEAENELAHNADEILSQYVAAEKADDQKRLKSDLRDMLVKQFDVQRQRRELELSRIEERVQKLRDQIKKRNDARETIIDRRLEQLTNEAEGLGWGQPAGPVGVRQPGSPYTINGRK